MWSSHRVSNDILDDNPEVKVKPNVALCTESPTHPIDKICHYFSNWTKIKRTVAWVLKIKTLLKTPMKHLNGYLSTSYIRAAETLIIEHVQKESFKDDIRRLSSDQKLSTHISLKNLDPHINQDGLIVVGGRLLHSSLQSNAKQTIMIISSPS